MSVSESLEGDSKGPLKKLGMWSWKGNLRMLEMPDPCYLLRKAGGTESSCPREGLYVPQAAGLESGAVQALWSPGCSLVFVPGFCSQVVPGVCPAGF